MLIHNSRICLLMLKNKNNYILSCNVHTRGYLFLLFTTRVQQEQSCSTRAVLPKKPFFLLSSLNHRLGRTPAVARIAPRRRA